MTTDSYLLPIWSASTKVSLSPEILAELEDLGIGQPPDYADFGTVAYKNYNSDPRTRSLTELVVLEHFNSESQPHPGSSFELVTTSHETVVSGLIEEDVIAVESILARIDPTYVKQFTTSTKTQ